MNIAQRIPNAITIIRIVLACWLTISLFVKGTAGKTEIVLLLVITFTDFLDGYFARRLAAQSVLGSYLDPIADKLTIIGVLGFFVSIDQIHTWFFVLLVFREVVQVIFRTRFFLYGKGTELPVLFVNKIKTAISYLFCILLCMNIYHYPDNKSFLEPGAVYAIEIAILFLSYWGWARQYYKKSVNES